MKVLSPASWADGTPGNVGKEGWEKRLFVGSTGCAVDTRYTFVEEAGGVLLQIDTVVLKKCRRCSVSPCQPINQSYFFVSALFAGKLRTFLIKGKTIIISSPWMPPTTRKASTLSLQSVHIYPAVLSEVCLRLQVVVL